jgi:putative ABC transport system permease protein
MIPPRWQKVLSDLSSNKVRTILVVLSIGIGVFAVGMVSTMYITLFDQLDAKYIASRPHSATLYMMPFDDDLVATVRKMDGIAFAEGRAAVTANILGPDGKRYPFQVQSIPPLSEMEMDIVKPLNPPDLNVPRDHEIFIERSMLAVMPIKPGDTVQFELPDERIKSLKVAGIVHDVATMPYMFTNQGNGYVSPDTLIVMGGIREYTQLNLLVSERSSDEEHVKEISGQVADKLEKGGLQVYFTYVYKPGEHPAKSIIQAVLSLLGGLGALAVFLSGFLVVNTITALLSQHTRQIGMMKSVGATSSQIIGMYLVLVLSFGILAFILAALPASLMGYNGAVYFANMLNFELNPFAIPLTSLILQIIVAILVPVVAAALPIVMGMRMTIREALSNYGLSSPNRKIVSRKETPNIFERIISRLLTRPLLISLRNTFRKKARLALTLSTLTLGGAIFISVFNLQASLNTEIEKTFGYFLSDLNLSLAKTYRVQEIASLVNTIPGITRIEGWGFSTGQLQSQDKQTSIQVLMIAPPSESTLIRPTITSGRWLIPGDENALVIGNHLVQKRPDLKVGDTVTLEIKGKKTSWKIVGIFLMAGNMPSPLIYANQEYLANLRNEVDRTSEYRIVTSGHDMLSQNRAAELLKQQMKDHGIQVSSIQTGIEIEEQQAQSINVLIFILLAMAVLIAVVGGLGLMGTMSMNVLERTREIGVMRAVGAPDQAILGIVITEGMLIGTISWALGALLAIPISKVLGDMVGYSLMTIPLRLVFSFNGFIIWWITVLIISALASFLPASNASRLTIREVLAYE